MELTAPDGTTISRVTVWRFGFKFRTADSPDGDKWFAGGKDANDNTIGGAFGETCENPEGSSGVCQFGSDGGLSAANERSYDVATKKLSWKIVCRALSGCERYFAGPAAGIELYGARVTLTDDSAPSLSAGGPALSGGWHRPGEAISVDASDNAGIRNVRAESGGATSGGARSCDSRGSCRARTSRAARSRCPPTPDGEQPVRIVAEDAAGNATVSDRQVLVDGTAPLVRLERPRGRTLRVHVEPAPASRTARSSPAAGRCRPRSRADCCGRGWTAARSPGRGSPCACATRPATRCPARRRASS